MTPEERASCITDVMNGQLRSNYDDSTELRLEAIIAAAIREAEQRGRESLRPLICELVMRRAGNTPIDVDAEIDAAIDAAMKVKQ